MKIGARKPSIKKRVTARTTGKIVRSAKRSVNPLYGKKGMGYVNNPKKAVYNKVYNKTTFGVDDILIGVLIFIGIFITYKIFSFVFWFFG